MFEEMMKKMIEERELAKRDYYENHAPKVNAMNKVTSYFNVFNQALAVGLIITSWLMINDPLMKLVSIGFIFALRHALHTLLGASASAYAIELEKQKDEIEATRMKLGE